MSGWPLITPRLRLRRWTDGDEEPMAAINRDPEVIRYLNRPVDERAVHAFFGVVADHWDRHAFGFYAVESREAENAGQSLASSASPTRRFFPSWPSDRSSAGAWPGRHGGRDWPPRPPPRRAMMPSTASALES